jgi:hypothetical protein
MHEFEAEIVQFELDGAQVPAVTAKVRLETGRWSASAALPKSATPGKIVPLIGKGATRTEALQNLVRLANYRLAFDEESRAIERRRLASAHFRSPEAG